MVKYKTRNLYLCIAVLFFALCKLSLSAMEDNVFRSLYSTDHNSRLNGIRILLKSYADDKKNLVPLFTILLSDVAPDVRCEAVRALGTIGSSASSSVPALLNILNNDTQPIEVRQGAIAALVSIRSNLECVIPSLIEIVSDKDRVIRGSSINALGEIGVDRYDISSCLLNYVNDEDISIRHAARIALKRITQNPYWDSVPVEKILNLPQLSQQNRDIKKEMDLIQAVKEQNIKKVKDLVDSHVYVNSVDKDDRTPLMWAVYENNIEIVRILLSAGADVNMEWCNGGNVIALAKRGNFKEILDLLLEFQNKHGTSTPNSSASSLPMAPPAPQAGKMTGNP